MKKISKKRLAREKGVSMAETALILSLIAMVLIPVLTYGGTETAKDFIVAGYHIGGGSNSGMATDDGLKCIGDICVQVEPPASPPDPFNFPAP